MFELWQFLAGLALFLLGLRFLEDALKNLAGRSFKKLLRRQTTSPLNGIMGGAGVTAIVQSSSVVSLMTMAFVGAGILSLKNAIGVIFGANLGTTITGWMVAALGFEVEIQGFALPLVAIGGLALAFFHRSEKLAEFGRLVLGFGLLFVGLAFMKESVDGLSQSFDITSLQGLHPYLLFPVGLVMAAIIQSSSAVMVMALSALNANVIPLESAGVLMIGANLGTTVTALLAGLNGGRAQQQLAASHFIFNFLTSAMALALLYPLLWLITNVIGVTNSLFTLVAFHTAFNLIGVIVLAPFIGLLARVLERKVRSGSTITTHISKVPTSVPEAAIEALQHEILRLTKMVLSVNVEGLRIEEGLFSFGGQKERGFRKATYTEHYEQVKQLQGEMVRYYLLIQNEKMEPADSGRLDHYVHALKHLTKSAKSIKDVTHDIREFESSSNDAKHALYKLLRGRVHELYLRLHHLLAMDGQTDRFESLVECKQQNHGDYHYMLNETYRQAKGDRLSQIEISTFLNANREIYSANKSLIEAMSDVLLTPQQADDFDKLPGRQ